MSVVVSQLSVEFGICVLLAVVVAVVVAVDVFESVSQVGGLLACCTLSSPLSFVCVFVSFCCFAFYRGKFAGVHLSVRPSVCACVSVGIHGGSRCRRVPSGVYVLLLFFIIIIWSRRCGCGVAIWVVIKAPRNAWKSFPSPERSFFCAASSISKPPPSPPTATTTTTKDRPIDRPTVVVVMDRS